MNNHSKELNLMTVKAVSQYLGISLDKAYAFMHIKGFPRVKVGRRYFVTREALIRWLESQECRDIAI